MAVAATFAVGAIGFLLRAAATSLRGNGSRRRGAVRGRALAWNPGRSPRRAAWCTPESTRRGLQPEAARQRPSKCPSKRTTTTENAPRPIRVGRMGGGPQVHARNARPLCLAHGAPRIHRGADRARRLLQRGRMVRWAPMVEPRARTWVFLLAASQGLGLPSIAQSIPPGGPAASEHAGTPVTFDQALGLADGSPAVLGAAGGGRRAAARRPSRSRRWWPTPRSRVQPGAARDPLDNQWKYFGEATVLQSWNLSGLPGNRKASLAAEGRLLAAEARASGALASPRRRPGLDGAVGSAEVACRRPAGGGAGTRVLGPDGQRRRGRRLHPRRGGRRRHLCRRGPRPGHRRRGRGGRSWLPAGGDDGTGRQSAR